MDSVRERRSSNRRVTTKAEWPLVADPFNAGRRRTGPHVEGFRCRTTDGDRVPSGIYPLRVEIGGYSETRKLVVLA